MPFLPDTPNSAWLPTGPDWAAVERMGVSDGGHHEPWLTIPNVLRILRRRLGLLIACTAGLSALGIGATLLLQPYYRAETLIVVDPRREQISKLPDVMSALPAEQTVLRSEVDMLRSHQLTKRVVEEAHLVATPEFNPVLQVRAPWSWFLWLDDADQRTLQARVVGWIDALLSRPETDAEDTGSGFTENETIAMTEATYRNKLDVLTDGRSLTIRLTVNSRDPELAARLANLHADLYVDEQLAAKTAATERARGWLAEHIPGLKADLFRAESAVQSFREEHNLIIGGLGTTVIAQQLSDLNTQLALVRVEKAQNQARYAQVRELLRSGAALESIPDVITSPLIQKFREQEAYVARLEADVSTRYTSPNHPAIISAKAQLRELQSALKGEISKIGASLQRQVDVSTAKEKALEESLQDLTRRAAAANLSEVKLRELQRDVDATGRLYETLLTRLRETSVGPSSTLTDSRIISRAEAPLWPDYPRYKLFYAASILIAAVASITLAFVLEGNQERLLSPNQCDELVGIRGIGLVPQIKGWPRRRIADCVVDNRGIPRDAVRSVFELVFAPRLGQRIGSVSITSTVPNEGKTIFAIWLARVSAMAGRRVLLVDGDFRRPAVSHYLGGADAATPEAVGRGHEIERLVSIDPATGMHYLTGLDQDERDFGFGSLRRLETLLQDMQESYDLIIVDSAPILCAPEALSVCQLTEGVIFAVRWGHTPYRHVRHAVSMLRSVRANLLGAVVTRANVRRHSSYGFGDAGGVYRRHSKYYSA